MFLFNCEHHAEVKIVKRSSDVLPLALTISLFLVLDQDDKLRAQFLATKSCTRLVKLAQYFLAGTEEHGRVCF